MLPVTQRDFGVPVPECSGKPAFSRCHVWFILITLASEVSISIWDLNGGCEMSAQVECFTHPVASNRPCWSGQPCSPNPQAEPDRE